MLRLAGEGRCRQNWAVRRLRGNLAESDVTVKKKVWIIMEGGTEERRGVFDWRGGGAEA